MEGELGTPLSFVWNCRDVSELILAHLDIDDLRRLRACNALLRSAVDDWGIERLVVCDESLTSLSPGRFPVVTTLVLRTVSARALDVLRAFGATGRLRHVEYSECTLGDVEALQLRQAARPVETLVVRDCVFQTQGALECLCAAHPSDVVRIQGVELVVVGKALEIIGTDEQQFLARLGASRKQCVIPGLPRAARTFSWSYNVHLSPQKPLWKSPAALWAFQETLERLDLSGNALALENVQLIFYEGAWRSLEKLRLRDCGLTESHMEIVSQATSCVALKHLDLGQNRLGTPIALYYLASSAQLTSNLEYLSLADQEETTEDWLYGLALTTSSWQLKTFNASKSSNVSATSMLGICESMPRLARLLLRTSYVTKDALTLLGRSDLFTTIEEIDFSVGAGACVSRGVEARRLEDCFCVRRAAKLKCLKLRASATRQSRKYDRKAVKALVEMHGRGVSVVVVEH